MQTPYRGFAPGSHWWTSVLELSSLPGDFDVSYKLKLCYAEIHDNTVTMLLVLPSISIRLELHLICIFAELEARMAFVLVDILKLCGFDLTFLDPKTATSAIGPTCGVGKFLGFFLS